jgi:hypothetical protein
MQWHFKLLSFTWLSDPTLLLGEGFPHKRTSPPTQVETIVIDPVSASVEDLYSVVRMSILDDVRDTSTIHSFGKLIQATRWNSHENRLRAGKDKECSARSLRI